MCFFLALALMPVNARAQAARSRRVSGNLVFWDQERGFRTIVANADVFTEISPFWYHAAADGAVRPYTRADGSTYIDPAIVSFLRSHGIRIIPTVANIENGTWNGPLVSRVVSDARVMQRHVDELVALAVRDEYDGIDIDYEDLARADRGAFTTFIRTLADALHARGKLLSVNVYGKTSDEGTWSGPAAQDWRALGAAADEVRLMTYEYHWSTSDAGPVAPVSWVEQVLEYARRTIAPEKIVHGVPFYGYDWVGRSGTDRVWDETRAILDRTGVRTNWDAESATPWFEYHAQGEQHVVWFENGASVRAKLETADRAGVGGVMLWRLAGEDPAVWPELRAWSPSPGGIAATGE